jgi:hypothetical protein
MKNILYGSDAPHTTSVGLTLSVFEVIQRRTKGTEFVRYA